MTKNDIIKLLEDEDVAAALRKVLVRARAHKVHEAADDVNLETMMSHTLSTFKLGQWFVAREAINNYKHYLPAEHAVVFVGKLLSSLAADGKLIKRSGGGGVMKYQLVDHRFG